MDIQEIYGLIDRFEASAIAELELEYAGAKLRLKKGSTYQEENVFQPVAKSDREKKTASSEEAGTKGRQEATTKSQASDRNITEVKAPLVGTFYRAASPEDKPFVMVGQSVKKGDVLGIIEAMKLMNEIVAPKDGVVESIQAENGDMVEYNQVLLTLAESE